MQLSILLIGGYEIDQRGLERMLQGTDARLDKYIPSGSGAIAAILGQPFNVVMLDTQVADCDPLVLLSEIRYVATLQPILLIASQENPVMLHRAAALGASGLILKSESRESMLAKLRTAVAGQSSWTREDLRRFAVSAAAHASENNQDELWSEREGNVLQCFSDGLTNKQISQKLGISYETVKEHVQHVLHKLGVFNRTQAAIWAVRRKLI